MQSQHPQLNEMFPTLTLPEVLAAAAVAETYIDVERMSMELTLRPDGPVPPEALDRLRHDLAEEYALRNVTLTLAAAADTPCAAPTAEAICALFYELCPAARGFLAGADFDFSEEYIEITLVNGGRELLLPHCPTVSEQLRLSCGRAYGIQITSRSDRPDAAFEVTEKIRREALAAAPAVAAERKKSDKKPEAQVIMGRAVRGEPVPMGGLNLDMNSVVVEGEVFAVNHRELKKRRAWVVCFDLTDYTGSVRVNKFMEEKDAKPIMDAVKTGMVLRVGGRITWDRFDADMVLDPANISVGQRAARPDTSEAGKRVELHMHTNMSSMDALTDPTAIVAQAAKWGHPAIAITDHGVAHAFPDMDAAGKKYGIKIIYGIEGYLVNDIDETAVVRGGAKTPLDGEFVAFDLETTGLSAVNDRITEIGAIRWKDGEVLDTFSTFVDPGRPIPDKIVQLTGITDDMVRGAPGQTEALTAFLDFVGERPLCAHNADFDMGFIREACRQAGLTREFTSLDTLELSRALLPKLKKHKLDIVADHLGLPKFNHHRATDDAMTVAHMLGRFFARLRELGVKSIDGINDVTAGLRGEGHRRTYHIVLLAKNKTGLRNLYKLISGSYLEHFKRYPLMPKSQIVAHREGLIIGSACENSELFSAVVAGRGMRDLKRIAAFYDYLEIQPLCNNAFMLRKGLAADQEQLRDFNRTVCRVADELGKPVCATGDVHFLRPEDEVFRHILLASKKFDDADEPLPLYFRSTDEMLAEFAYLGEELCHRVVIDDPNRIADAVEAFDLLPKELFTPTIENSAEDLQRLVYDRMHALYGEQPPELVTQRVETELGDILGRHYDVIYMSAQKLVADSLEHGYLVGSRGSVGSSIVAYMSGITEVNSLPPHYRCPKCKYSDFSNESGAGCGADMPDAVCPVCGEKLDKDGFDIPFETFLGFGGDKVPDIDLNFSGEYQGNAHKYTETLFGRDHVFKAGTIGTLADKTAYGYVKKYLEERGITASKAEENRLALGCVGVKRTTGQHPGGLVIIPQDMEVTDFCPVQHPADDPGSDIITTHFDYHKMEANLLKLDELGHDDPTMIRMLEDLTGIDAKRIPFDDPETMGIFKSPEPLGLPADDPIIGAVGTFGVPEFGTGFAQQMLVDIQPTEFNTLVRFVGFSHGTDVWLGNAKDLILSGTAGVNACVGCRDDIMLYLISRGMEPKKAFKIMESVRKGKVKKGGFQEGWVEEMQQRGVPQWYIDSLAKIAYLFPKAHAVAYVMMAFRIAWFKVHQPLAFYAAYFYRRSQKDSFDAECMVHGIDVVRRRIHEIEKNPNATAKEQDLLTTLVTVYEFYLRGFSFTDLDLYESDALRFLPVGKTQLRPPFVSVAGLGETAAHSIVDTRSQGREFVSIEEFALNCPKVSKTHIEQLKALGAFGTLPDSSQITLF